MKKLLLLGLLLILAAFAWADVYPIGDLGTSSAATYGPFTGYYDYSWSKTIVTAAEMTAAGYDGTDDMIGVGYYVGNTPSNYTMVDLHMFIRHTDLSSYTTVTDETGTAMPDSSAFTQVFSGDLTFNGGGWYYISFNLGSFDWDGTSNIEIFWKNWDGDYVTGYPTWRYSNITPDYRVVYKQQDNSFPTTTGTRTTYRSNLAIVTPQMDPPNPAVLVYPTNAGWIFLDGVLSWSDGGGMPDGYDVYLDTVNGSTLVSDNQTGTTYTPTLAPGTTYYWKVIPYNANGPATNCPVWSFKTPTATQLAESFDATTFPPTGWANPNSWSRSTTTPYYGAGCAYKSASTTPAILSTPLLAINGSSALDFCYRTASTTGYGLLNVKYSTDRQNWNQIGATIVMPTTTTWNNASVALGAIPAGNYYLAFEVSTSTSTSSIYIDHVFGPEAASVAPDPVTLTAPANAAIDVAAKPTFTWTAAAIGGIPTGYKVYCDTNANPSTQIADVTTTTFTATTALAYSTTYYWKVVAYNATGNSADSEIRSFTVMADPTIYAPWMEDFGTTGTTFPPMNWTRWSGLLTSDPVTLSSATTGWVQDDFANIVTDPTNKCAKINIYGSTSIRHWLMTPPIQMPGTSYQLEFDIALTDWNTNNPITDDPSGTTGVDDKFVVLIGDGTSWSTANAVKIWDNDDQTSGGIYEVYNDISHTGDHYVLSLDNYTGIQYIAFYGESTVSNADNDFFVDNVRIRQAGQAPAHVTLNSPEDLALVDPGNVLLSWTENISGGAAEWFEIYVGSELIDPVNDYYGEYLYESTTSSLDLDAQSDIVLGFNTTWYWAVLPYNSVGSPDPTGMIVFRFTTLPDPTIVALPHEEYFDSVTAPALPYGWSAYINSTSTSAYVRTTTTYPVSAPNSVYLTNSSDTAADLRLITPPIDASIPLNTIKLKFSSRSGSAGYPLLVGTVDTPDGTGTFTQIASIDLTATHTVYDVSFEDYTGTDQYICFKHGLGSTYRSLYVDNVQLIELLANDLAATAISGPALLEYGTAYDFTVSVFNEGTAAQSAYNVNLMSESTVLATVTVNTPLDPGATAQHTLSWTPMMTSGFHQIYGKVVLAGDGNSANDATPLKKVYALESTAALFSVGNDATTSSGYYLPLGMYHKNSVTEELYFNDEMHLQSGTITAIVYKNTFSSNLQGKPVKIWMAHTAATNLSDGWLPAQDYTLVFDGLVDFPSGINHIVIPLTTPYQFTGGTLATRVNRPVDTQWYSSSDKFFYTTTADHPNRSRYLLSDSVTYDPMAPSAAGTLVGYVPNTIFVVDNAVTSPEAVLSGHVYDSVTSSPIEGAMVSLTERAVAYTDVNGYYEFVYWDSTFVDLTCSATDYYSSTVTGISFEPGTPVTQNFNLQPLPSLTVSGVVTANDYPAGLAGALVELFGYHDYSTITDANGAFSIANVKGRADTLSYSWVVSKEGYQSEIGAFDAITTDINLGTINLTEYLWTPYNLVASHEGNDARLNWDPAEQPDFLFFDFEQNDGGFTVENNPSPGWEWGTSSYSGAHSGTKVWGTVLEGNYANSATYDLISPLSYPIESGGYLTFWHRYNFEFYTTPTYYDGGIVQISTDDGGTWSTITPVGGYPCTSSSSLGYIPMYGGEQLEWTQASFDLSEYVGQTVRFKWRLLSESSVNREGWYVDDVLIGVPTAKTAMRSSNSRSDGRALLNYSVYRFPVAEEETPSNWTLLSNNCATETYLDTGFSALSSGAYKWAVKANYSGSLESEAIISNPLGIFGTPQNVVATASGNSVTLTWTAEPGASYYVIYGSHDPYGTYTILGYSATNSYVYSTATDPFHFFKIAAADGVMPQLQKNK